MGLIYPYDLSNGTTADADEVMANLNEIKNNYNFDTLDDASANAAAMQATTDPYPVGSESLATDGLGELKRLRYVIRQILGTQYWFIYPDMVTKTTTYTATVNDEIILCDTSGGAWTLTLPTAVGNQHKKFYIKKTTSDANALTIDGNGSETIDGSTTQTLSGQYNYIVIVSDNSNWQIISEKGISGSYSPSLTSVANVDSTSAATGFYIREGSIVTADVYFQVDATAASTLTRVRASLPVSSNLAASNSLIGTGTFSASTDTVFGAVVVYGDSTNDELEIRFTSATTSVHNIRIQFKYVIA